MNLRLQIASLRRAISPDHRLDWSRRISSSVSQTDIWKQAKTICLYISLQEEVDTSILLRLALGERKTVCVPKTIDDKVLRLYRIRTFDDLALGRFGIYEPKPYCLEIQASFVDLFIVPGIAFDTKGNRLGWGKGYYDQLLSTTTGHKMGLAFNCQIVPRLNHKKYDIPMDTVITEKEVYYAKAR